MEELYEELGLEDVDVVAREKILVYFLFQPVYHC
jgi:hypothetical protein